jgi:hypothetical protein
MGFKESKEIHFEVIRGLNNTNPDGACAPLALIDSLPGGYPPRNKYPEIAANIIRYLSDIPDTGDEAWFQVAQWFWPEIQPDDIAIRSANVAFLDILEVTRRHKLPITFQIPTANDSAHAIGSRFINKPGIGTVAELAYGLENERPYIPLSGNKPSDQNGILQALFDSGEGLVIIFPKINSKK